MDQISKGALRSSEIHTTCPTYALHAAYTAYICIYALYMPYIRPIYALPDLVMEDGQKMFLKYHTIPSRAFKVKAHTNVESKSLKLLDLYICVCIYIHIHYICTYISSMQFFSGNRVAPSTGRRFEWTTLEA